MVKQFSFTLDLSHVLDNIWDNEYLCQNTSDWLHISSIEIYHSASKLSECQEIDWYLKFPRVFFPSTLFIHIVSSLFFSEHQNIFWCFINTWDESWFFLRKNCSKMSFLHIIQSMETFYLMKHSLPKRNFHSET